MPATLSGATFSGVLNLWLRIQRLSERSENLNRRMAELNSQFTREFGQLSEHDQRRLVSLIDGGR